MSQRKPVVVIKDGDKLDVPSAMDCNEYVNLVKNYLHQQNSGNSDKDILAVIVSDNSNNLVGESTYYVKNVSIVEINKIKEKSVIFVVVASKGTTFRQLVAEIAQGNDTFFVNVNRAGSIAVSYQACTRNCSHVMV